MNNQKNEKQKFISNIGFLNQPHEPKTNNQQSLSQSKVVLSHPKLQNYIHQHQISLEEDQSQNQMNPKQTKHSFYKQKSQRHTKYNTVDIRQTDKPQKKLFHLTKALVYHLYRQNIKNYNPYIESLSLLEEEERPKQMQAQMIRNLCYIGIAKNYIKSKKYSAAANYTPVNVLIRTYMRDQMCKEIMDKQQNNQNLALSFNPFNYPSNLEEVLTKPLYTEIIHQVNKIILHEYIEYKKINSYQNDESLLGKILLGFIIILCAVFAIRQTKQLLFMMFGLGLIWIAYIIYLGKINLQKMVESRNVTRTIEQKLIKYFDAIKTQRMEWKVGKDFYWLQIHYIKKKKKDFKI